MATFDLEEQEQLSELKLFWQQNGKFIIAGVTGALVAVAGWQAWNWHLSSTSEKANATYGELVDAAAAQDTAKVKVHAQALIAEHPGTIQSSLGALVSAKSAWDAKDTATAKIQLTFVAEKGEPPLLRDVANLRLAGVMLDEKNYDGALERLGQVKSESYAPRMLDLKGDVLAAHGKPAEARTAWNEAISKIDAAPKDDNAGEKPHAALRDAVTAKLQTLEPAK